MTRHPDPHRADERRANVTPERAAHNPDSPVPTKPAEEGEPPQSPGAKPLEKKPQQQH